MHVRREDAQMGRTKAQRLAQQNYNNRAYDQILIRVKKGKREEYRKEGELRGLGLMELFRVAVEEYIANHKVETE